MSSDDFGEEDLVDKFNDISYDDDDMDIDTLD